MTTHLYPGIRRFLLGLIAGVVTIIVCAGGTCVQANSEPAAPQNAHELGGPKTNEDKLTPLNGHSQSNSNASVTNPTPAPPTKAGSETSSTNAADHEAKASLATTNELGAANDVLRNAEKYLATTNLVAGEQPDRQARLLQLKQKFDTAQSQLKIGNKAEARMNFTEILETEAPDDMKKSALFELAIMAQGDNQLARAQQIFAQYVQRWPNDLSVPEVLLRQGLILRQMGLNNAALGKFYAVMTTALVLKPEKYEQYQRLVLQAQTEIAETHYQLGKQQDAIEFFSRLLKLDAPSLNKPQIYYKLIRSIASLGRHEEVVVQANDFFAKYSNSVERAEVRFFLATALKQLGRNNESRQQVMLLLKEQKASAFERPEVLAYWQQRAGNEIANQFYREGEYVSALNIYENLAQLDPTPTWQLPVKYQIGLCYERLQQPQKAKEAYEDILKLEKDLGTEPAPNLRLIVELAKLRRDFISWHDRAEGYPAITGPLPFARLPRPMVSAVLKSPTTKPSMPTPALDVAPILFELQKLQDLGAQFWTVVSQENQDLNRPEERSDFSAYRQRKDLLPALDKSLDNLRAMRMAWLKVSEAERATCPEVSAKIRASQELIMKIIVLDRENEQALLRRGLIPARHLPSVNRSRPHYVAALYQRHLGC